MLGARIHLNRLAALCRRLAIATEAGLDDRRIWQRETELKGRTWRRYVGRVHEAVAHGASVTSGLEATDNYFPQLFRELVAVGERSGKLGYVYRRLAEHYERKLRVQRALVAQLTWPLLQLGIAGLVVGLLIWVVGILPQAVGAPQLDPTGLGLAGMSGVILYANCVVGLGIVALILLEASRRGAPWTRWLEDLALRLPVVGRALETLCLARIAWSLHLTLDTDMSLLAALPLVLRSAGNRYYEKHSEQVVREIQQGQEIHEALAATGAFPGDFLDVVAVGETSGSLAESMGRLSEQYEQRAEAAIRSLSVLASIAVWIVVALLIISMIIRLAFFYISVLQNALG